MLNHYKQTEKTPSQMVDKLLEFLLKGGDDTMDHFISSLEASNQHHVVQLLLRESCSSRA